MRFGYQKEKLAEARRALMLPHPHGESESIANAFHACHLGLKDLDKSSLSEVAQEWARKIEEYMDTSGLSYEERGLWAVKADSLTEDQKFELASIIDELADHFNMEYWGDDS